MTELRLGQIASGDDRFCPFAAVAKYPYRYFSRNQENQKAVAERFWDGGRFSSHGWNILFELHEFPLLHTCQAVTAPPVVTRSILSNLVQSFSLHHVEKNLRNQALPLTDSTTSYYIHTLSDSSPAPLLLISKTEVEVFFQEVKAKIGIYLPFPDVATSPGFDIGFCMEGEPRPRYLGRLTHQTSLSDLLEMVPAEGMATEEPLVLDDRTFPAFKKKMEAAITAGKNRNREQKDKKKNERLIQKGRWCDQLKRTQCYLGLRRKVTSKLEDFDKNPNATWEESQEAEEAYKVAAGINLPPLSVFRPTPYPFYLDAVFVCVDIESDEHCSRRLTEIGITTLDTRDLVNTAPGECGIEWMKKMRCRHFRVADYAHIVNKDFVSGCPDKFEEALGISEWISEKDIPQVLGACFREPYSTPGLYTAYPTDLKHWPRHDSNIPSLVNLKVYAKRNLILVGHNIQSDITYMRSAGYDISNLSNLLEAVDTNDLWRAWKHEQQATKLGNILLELEITGWHLHNAGNDAAYTMQAVIGMSLAALDPARKAPAAPPVGLLDQAALEARQRLTEEAEEWANADAEGSDGGAAVSLAQAAFNQGMSKGRKFDERTVQRTWSQNRQRQGGKTSAPPKAETRKSRDGAAQKANVTSMAPTRFAAPHLRGLVTPVTTETKLQLSEATASVTLPPLSAQIQRRLVIMDDEEYGM